MARLRSRTLWEFEMGSIFDLPSAWRVDWKPASFRGAVFHVDSNSRESGRRIVEHEFPKKTLPYAEDMGRRAKTFSLRGYIITYPSDMQGPRTELFRRDYRIARDALRQKLEDEGSGQLVLSTTRQIEIVTCTSYRLTEEARFGGFCTFDMTFMEAGLDPQQTSAALDTAAAIAAAAGKVLDQGVTALSGDKQPAAEEQAAGP